MENLVKILLSVIITIVILLTMKWVHDGLTKPKEENVYDYDEEDEEQEEEDDDEEDDEEEQEEVKPKEPIPN